MRWRVGLMMLLVLSLTLVGCGGDGDGDGGSGTTFVAATSSSLANQSFIFPTGLTPNFATRFGLPAGQAFSLQFGVFTGTSAPAHGDGGIELPATQS